MSSEQPEVFSLGVTLKPLTTCEPPEGVTCPLSGGTTRLSAVAAHRHAADNPGHYVVRDTINRVTYVAGELPQEDAPGGGSDGLA